jgi:hypothetical protein
MKELSELSADRAMSWTYQHKVEGRKLNDATIGVQLKLRKLLRDANRFNLDDDSTILVCHLAHEFKRQEHWAFLARLPHDPMWIEFDCAVKLREFERMGTLIEPYDPGQSFDRIGYLLHRDDNGPTPRWAAHGFGFDHKKNVTNISPLMSIFDPEGDPRFPPGGSHYWKTPTLSKRPGFPKMPVDIRDPETGEVVSETTCDPELVVGGILNPGQRSDEPLHAPAWVAQRIAVCVSPWWETYWRNERSRLHDIALNECKEERGVLRWIVCLLAAINGLPSKTKPVFPTKVRRSIGMNWVPYFEHHDLSITIPREDRLLRARQLLDGKTGRKNRRHGVVGFWRIVEYGKRTHICRHEPVMVESGLGICQKCELLVRWVDPMERGDEKLGYVEKTYQVRT